MLVRHAAPGLSNTQTFSMRGAEPLSATVDNRPANAFGNPIGDTFVYESTAAHKANVEQIIKEYEAYFLWGKAEKLNGDNTKRLFIFKLKQEYARRTITQDTFTAVLRILSAHEDTKGQSTATQRLIASTTLRLAEQEATQTLDQSLYDHRLLCTQIWDAFHTQYSGYQPSYLLADIGFQQLPDLQKAIISQDQPSAEMLIACGADVNEITLHHEGSLHTAAVRLPKLIPLLLKHGANLEMKATERQSTPLHYAAQESAEAVIILLKAGANWKSMDTLAGPPIAYCIDKLDIVKAFIETPNFDINYQYGTKGATALHYAMRNKKKHHPDVVRYLLSKDANPNLVESSMKTHPLFLAVRNTPDMIPVLIDHGADPDLMDSAGSNAIIAALDANNIQAVEALMKSGAYIDAVKLLRYADSYSTQGHFTHLPEFKKLLEKYLVIQADREWEKTKNFWYPILVNRYALMLFAAVAWVLGGGYNSMKSLFYNGLQLARIKKMLIALLNDATQDILISKWQIDFYIDLHVRCSNELQFCSDYAPHKELIIKTLTTLLEKHCGVVSYESNKPGENNKLRVAIAIKKTVTSAAMQTIRNKLISEVKASHSAPLEKFKAVATKQQALMPAYQALGALKNEALSRIQNAHADALKNHHVIISLNSNDIQDKNVKKSVDRIHALIKTMTEMQADVQKKEYTALEHAISLAEINARRIETLNRELPTFRNECATGSNALDAQVKTIEMQIAKERESLAGHISGLNELLKKIAEEATNYNKAKEHFARRTTSTQSSVLTATKEVTSSARTPAADTTTPQRETSNILQPPAPAPLSPAPTGSRSSIFMDATLLRSAPDTRHQEMPSYELRPPAPAPVLSNPPVTLFATADTTRTLPREKKTRNPALHARAAVKYAKNMRAHLTELLNEEHPDPIDREILLHGILYNILRLVQSLWHITLHHEGEERLQKYIATHRHLLVHGAAMQIGTDININHIVLAAIYLRDNAIPMLQQIEKQTTPQAITEQTAALIRKLNFDAMDLFLLSDMHIQYDQETCHESINQAITLIIKITKQCTTPEALNNYVSRNDAAKLLIVKIGEYWKRLLQLDAVNIVKASQDTAWGEAKYHGLSIDYLNECLRLRNLIGHITTEDNEQNSIDIPPHSVFRVIQHLNTMLLLDRQETLRAR